MGRLDETGNGIGETIDKKQEEIGDREASEMESGEVDKHLRELKTIGSGLDRAEKEKDRNDEEYRKLLNELNKLKDEIVEEVKEELKATQKEDEGLQKDTDDKLGDVGEKLGALDKKLADASNGIRDPDKLAALNILKKKLKDAKGKKEGLEDSNGKNKGDSQDCATQQSKMNPEEDMIE